ncbi:MAG: hypothetical protein PVF49_01245 [Anaerolineales bacterium]|jgi:hypothetical protein
MSKFRILSIFMLLILFSTACDATPTQTAGPDPIVDTAVAATVTALAPMSTEAATADAVAPCPVETSNPPPPALSGPESFPSQIQAYLNQGGSLEELGQLMESHQLDPHEGLPFSQQDFTSDGLEDIAISILNGDGAQIAPAGSLLLFVCQHDQYQLAYTSPPSTELAAPFIRAAQDLNGDSIPDLLTTRETCGAHTCAFEVNVLSWQDGALRSIFPDVTTDIPLPFVDLEGPQENGTYNIVVTGSGIASAGAGPYRRFSKVWSYDPVSGLYHFANTYLHDSTYRIHFVHDADQAFLDGDLQTALDLYDRVIHDDSLDDWAAGEEGARTLAAYATYRRVLTFLRLGQNDAARAELNLLESSFPADTTGYAYVALAQSLWNQYLSGGDLTTACQAAQDYAQTHSQTILDPLYYGYANKTYVAGDICPIAD